MNSWYKRGDGWGVSHTCEYIINCHVYHHQQLMVELSMVHYEWLIWWICKWVYIGMGYPWEWLMGDSFLKEKQLGYDYGFTIFSHSIQATHSHHCNHHHHCNPHHHGLPAHSHHHHHHDQAALNRSPLWWQMCVFFSISPAEAAAVERE